MRAIKETWASPGGRAGLVTSGLVVAFLVWAGARTYLPNAGLSLLPHRTCYQDDARLIWLHVTSDFLIGIAYASISMTLVYLVQKARVPFHLAFIAFGIFIGACGCTHFMEVWTIWEPQYWLAGVIKVVTAVASVTTAVWLYPLLPQAMRVIKGVELAEERRLVLEATHSQLEAAHKELEATHGQLKLAHEKSQELDQIKTDFFSNVSHELRTPLTLILGPAQQLLANGTIGAEQRHSLETIERNAQLLLKHVNDLLDLSKLDARRLALNYGDVDLAQLFRLTAGYFDSLARERSISLSVEAPPQLRAQVDPEKIQRALFNLLSNAFKFAPATGTVRCVLSNSGGDVSMVVQDNGPGVPEKYRAEIFERFRQIDGGQTRRTGGTGLGLSIVKEFVQLHRGKVGVTETPGGGATFSITLPARAPEGAEVALQAGPETQAQTERIAVATLAELRPRKIPETKPAELTAANRTSTPLVLVVEDNTEMSHFIASSLTRDFQVETAFDGAEGVAKAVALHPDVIISDLMMPIKTGEEMLKELQSIPEMRNTPVIMLTAKADDDLRVRLLQQGAHDYMMKPIVLEELRARVGNLSSIKRTRDILQTELTSSAQSLESLARQLASKQREAQAARVIAEHANRSKDEFLMTLSHELRTPLTSIFGWVRMIRMGGLDEKTVAHAIDTIERNVKVQVHLIEDLLDISRIVAGKMRLNLRPMELAQAIRLALEIAQPTATARNIAIDVHLTDDPCPVSGDADRLQQIVWNLLINAIKFTPKGGNVAVSLSVVNAAAELRISDTGQGIKPEFLSQLFERFRQADSSTTRNHGGLGLGLALVRSLVELHGGSVRAHSDGLGKGATFTVTLPLLAEGRAVVDGAEAATRVMPDLSGMKVLVVEDESDTRELIVAMLVKCGCSVFPARTTAEALTHLETARPDLIVSDIALPDGDGLTFMRKVRASEPGIRAIPAIALTAFAGDSDKSEALAAGFQLHLSKPIEPIELSQAVKRMVDGQA